MKKVTVIIVVAVLLIAAEITQNYYMDKLYNNITSQISAVETPVAAEEKADALQQLDNLSKHWEEKRFTVEIFTTSVDTRAISVTIAEIRGSLEADDFKNARSRLAALQTQFDNLHQSLDFSFSDVL